MINEFNILFKIFNRKLSFNAYDIVSSIMLIGNYLFEYIGRFASETKIFLNAA
jgi:hypothetical protein